jgi:hypothetical protein
LSAVRQDLKLTPPSMPIEKVQPFLREAEMLIEGNPGKSKE